MFGYVSASAGKWKKVPIYKVPSCIRGGNNEEQRAYTPQIVSIRPYHHGEDHLKLMEEHKQQALFHCLKRSNKPFETFMNSVAPKCELNYADDDPISGQIRNRRLLSIIKRVSDA
ncbi:hypothetical protein V6N11_082019 [Hibiscus sabdariffa]|uniref:Uncharacterized protein n=1 Tax=Hibiscus sabdariffa TaxID=183260 RepID=A0ABR1Z9M7_9ROSI